MYEERVQEGEGKIMTTREKYLHIAKVFDSGAVGAPLNSELMELMTIWFPEGPILDVASVMDLQTRSAHEIAQLAGMSDQRAYEVLEEMAARGTIWSIKQNGQHVYKMMELLGGVYELMDVSPVWERTPELRAQKARYKKLWKLYLRKAMFNEQGLAEVSLLHVMPSIGSNNPNVIYPYEDIVEVVKKQKGNIAVARCMCRDIEQNCDHLMDVCLAFNEAADFEIEYNMGRQISVDECIEILKKTEEDGLVHQGTNNKEKLLFICNCCKCCCMLMRPYVEYKYPYGTTKSSVYATVQEDKCIGCGTCEKKRCPMEGAIVVDPATKKAVTREDLCLGCGVCQIACPTDAIEMKPRPVMPICPDTIDDMVKIIRRIKADHRADPNYIPGEKTKMAPIDLN